MEDVWSASSPVTELALWQPNGLARSMVVARLAKGPPLLPQTIASLVSALSIASRISLRSTALMIEAILESIRLSTMVSLGLTRRALIAAVSSARTMHYVASGLDYHGRDETGNIAEKGPFMSALDHYTNVGVYVITHVFTLAELFSLAGLSLTSSISTFGFFAAEESVRMLDGLLGSGETSRALAAIIALVRSEFCDDEDFPMLETQGAVGTLTMLTKTLTAFVCLQAATRKRTAREMRMRVIYDCTVIDQGQTFVDDQEDDPMDSDPSESRGPVAGSRPSAREGTFAPGLENTHAVEETQAVDEQVYEEFTELCETNGAGGESVDLPQEVREALAQLQERGTQRSFARGVSSNYEIQISETTTTTTTVVRTSESRNSVEVGGLGQSFNGSIEHPIRQATEAEEWVNLEDAGMEDKASSALVMARSLSPQLEDDGDDNGKSLVGADPSLHGRQRLQVVLQTMSKKFSRKTRTMRQIVSSDESPAAIPTPLQQTPPRGQKRPSLPEEWTSGDEASPVSDKGKNPFRAIGKALRKTNTGGAFVESFDRVRRNRSGASSRTTSPPSSPPVFATPLMSPVLSATSPASRHSRQNSDSSFRLDSSRRGSIAALSPLAMNDLELASPPRIRRAPSLQSMRSIVTTCKHAASPTEEAEPKASNFPRRHLVENLQRFMRYSSASYGQFFLRILGLGKNRGLDFTFPDTRSPANNHAFAHHVGIRVEDILLDTYSDMQTGIFDNEKISPIVNYVTVDHDMEAVVLSCRGSLGLSDLLVDLTCAYENIHVPDGDPLEHYYVHSGMWHSATRMQRGLVHETIRQALLQYPDYGLVLCGHSLGGGVAALLSILWSCPISAFNRALSQSEFLASRTRYPPLHTAFVTSFASGLPAGRPIKCYTYGPPCVSSLDLQRYCQGLVVSTVHNNDVVPTLSLGLLRDLKTTAMNLHEDRQNGTTQEIIGRVVGLWRSKVSQEQARRGEPPSSSPLKIAGYGIGSLYDPSGEERQVALTGAEIAAGRGDNRALDPAYVDPLLGEQDASDELVTNDYLWSVMRTLRASNDNDKLYPPGDIYCVENYTVFISSESNQHRYSRREGRRILLRAVEDVVKRFSEPLFGKSLFFDHSPSEYEQNLDLLAQAVLG